MELNGTPSGRPEIAAGLPRQETDLKNKPSSYIELLAFRDAESLLNFDKMLTIGYKMGKKSLGRETAFLIRFLLNPFSDALIKERLSRRRRCLENRQGSG